MQVFLISCESYSSNTKSDDRLHFINRDFLILFTRFGRSTLWCCPFNEIHMYIFLFYITVRFNLSSELIALLWRTLQLIIDNFFLRLAASSSTRMHLGAALIVSFSRLIAATCFRDSGPTDWSCIRRDKEASKRKKLFDIPLSVEASRSTWTSVFRGDKLSRVTGEKNRRRRKKI